MIIKSILQKLRQFLTIDLWKVKSSSLPPVKGYLYRVIRVWVISITEFNKDKIPDKASALTFFNLLSIVPVIAMAFGIAKGFGLEEYLVAEMERYFTGQETVVNQLLLFSKRMLESANGGIISGISFLVLFFTVIRLMSNIEMAFNEIWNTKSRGWDRKVADYLAIILLAPLFLIISSSLTVVLSNRLAGIARGEAATLINQLIYYALQLTPFIIISLLLTFLYLIFPNTKVKLRPAFFAGMLAGVGYQLTQFAWLNGQIYLSKYNAIYGTFAALPLFMIYLQITWIIILFGAEYAFAMQNSNEWDYENAGLRLSHTHRRKLTFLVMYYLIKEFESGNKPMIISQLSAKTHVPFRFILSICREMEEAGIILKVIGEETEAYIPSMDIQKISIQWIFDKLDSQGFDGLKSEDDEIYTQISEMFSGIDTLIKGSPYNILLKDLKVSYV